MRNFLSVAKMASLVYERENCVTDFVLERTCPKKHLNLSKSCFVSQEDHRGFKSKTLQLEL